MPDGVVLIGPSVGAQQEERICRFCSQKVHGPQGWRKKDRMCTRHACWEQFIAELKLAV